MLCCSIDATKATGLCRLVNDNHKNPNARMKKEMFNSRPVLCLYAVGDLSPGEEIRFDYGPDENKAMWWRHVRFARFT